MYGLLGPSTVLLFLPVAGKSHNATINFTHKIPVFWLRSPIDGGVQPCALLKLCCTKTLHNHLLLQWKPCVRSRLSKGVASPWRSLLCSQDPNIVIITILIWIIAVTIVIIIQDRETEAKTWASQVCGCTAHEINQTKLRTMQTKWLVPITSVCSLFSLVDSRMAM